MCVLRGLRLAVFTAAIAAMPHALASQAPKPRTADVLSRAAAAFRAGLAAQQSGKIEAARALFAEAVRLAPSIPESHQALGAVLLELDKPAEASAELEAAFKLKPGDPGIETDLALAYARSGQPSLALPHFQAVFARSQQSGGPPVDALFCESFARALAATGKKEDAIVLFRAAADRGGNAIDLADNIGSLYAQLGQWDQARAEFERALTLNPAFVPARIHLGVVLRRQHDFTGSVSALTAATGLEPSNALAQFEIGRTFAAAGRDEEALPPLQKAVQLDAKLPGAALELAMALQRLGRQQEAVPWFERAIAQEPHNSAALTNLGLALTLTGKATEALPYIQRALAERPNDAVIHKDLGVAHIQLSAFDDAIADFKSALELDPADPQVHYDLGLAYKFKDRMDEAVAELSRAGQMDPTLQDPPYTLGILYMQMGKLDDAVVELRKAVALRPDNGDAWAILGSTLKQNSRLDEAREALEKAVPLLPGQPGPRVTLAAVLADQASAAASAADASDAAGDPQKAAEQRAASTQLRTRAAEYRRQAADLARGAVNRQKAAFALNAGNQLLLRGQIADAVARYQESIAADPTFAEAHSQLAQAYDRQGRPADAAAERDKAAQLTAK